MKRYYKRYYLAGLILALVVWANVFADLRVAPAINSIGFSVPGSSIFTATGTPLTSSGTIGFTTAATQGGIIYGSSSSAISSTGAGSSGQVLQSNGSSAPTWGSNGLPGTIVAFAGSTCPTGTLVADGSAVSRSTYANLFSAISTTWGTGDGSSTFNVPNLVGVFLRGIGTQTVGGITYAGPSLGASQGDQLQGHKHTETIRTGFLVTRVASTSGFLVNTDSTLDKTSTPVDDGTNGTPRTGTETRPINYGVKYCVVF